ncbi:MAG: GFA family protein [Gammaproteobacteria bacterium]|nr:GFA family protein [Gammaproteobacteria bacterium]
MAVSDVGVRGSCLCGRVGYEITGNLGIFQYCHCSRCRKFTGSAHASNLFVSASQFRWLRGEAFVTRYEPDDAKYFATSFCKKCGSSLPWAAKIGSTTIVPAGTLDGDPGIRPGQNIFCASQATWYVSAGELKRYDGLPTKPASR